MQVPICTAPCFPKCTAPAVSTLKTLNGIFLGCNCDNHVPKLTAKDYKIEPLSASKETP